MNRTEKIRQVENLSETIGQSAHAFLVDFRGLDVARSTDLRTKLRESGGQLRIVKNRLAKRAIADTPLAELEAAFVGQTAVAYPTGDDVIGVAKVLREFAREHEVATVKAGIVDGEVITPEQFKELAELPSREMLIAKALYLMMYPISGLATALNGVLRNFVVVLDQIRQHRENE